jgi:F0F1-type ATP synthase membrane subunit c/vacuolar-type H+-ATPase subunit K
MLAITASKFLALGLISITLSGAAIGTGVLFAGYNIGAARNPDEAENLFNTSLMAFALIETFVFLSILIGVVIFFL